MKPYRKQSHGPLKSGRINSDRIECVPLPALLAVSTQTRHVGISSWMLDLEAYLSQALNAESLRAHILE